MLGNPLTLRLSPEKQVLYEDAAARCGKPLSTYLRERLEEGERVTEELASLRIQLASLRHFIQDKMEEGLHQGDGFDASSQHANTPIQIEMLLLLRALAGAEKIKVVHAELKRHGLPVWTPSEALHG